MAYLEHKPRVKALLSQNAIDYKGEDCDGNDGATGAAGQDARADRGVRGPPTVLRASGR